MDRSSEVVDVPAVVATIDRELPRLARDIITAHLDLDDPMNAAFLAHPDGREQHQMQWHQWGIISHTRMFLVALDRDVPRILREWGLWPAARTILARPIDGATRWDLLRVAVMLHDIGKFGARTHGHTGFHFGGHERLSGQIVRERVHLDRYGLTGVQREYVARAAEDHFVLGVARKRARERGRYSVEFAESEEFAALALAIKAAHPDDFCEIGALFLGDSLAKIDLRRGPERALSQHPINLAVARRYLAITLEVRSI